MNKIGKGIACGLAGFSSVTLGCKVFVNTPEITDKAIEQCSKAIEAYHINYELDPNKTVPKIPKQCEGATSRVLLDRVPQELAYDDMYGDLHIKNAGYPIIPSVSEFEDRAHEQQELDARERVTQIGAIIIIASGGAGVLFNYWDKQNRTPQN